MKIFKKSLALALVLSILLSFAVVPAGADITGTDALTLSLVATSDAAGTKEVSSVKNGETFYVVLKFSGNTEAENVKAFAAFISYDTALMSVTRADIMGAAAGGTANASVEHPAKTGTINVAAVGFSSTDGFFDTTNLVTIESGLLMRLSCKAKADLDTTTLAPFKFEFHESADKTTYFRADSGLLEPTYEELSLPVMVANTGVLTGDDTIAAPTAAEMEADGAATATYTALFADAEGNLIKDPKITWDVDYTNYDESLTMDLVSVTKGTGVVSVTNLAAATEYTLTATCGTATATKTFTVTKDASVADSVVASGADSITVPADGEADATATYTATVYDQYGVEMTGANKPALSWNVSSGSVVNGVSIEDGTLTVKNAAKANQSTSYTVTAKVADNVSVKDELSVTIAKAASVVTTIEIEGAESITIPQTGSNFETYNAKAYDQYGAVYAVTPSYTLSKLAGVTISGSTVTVASTATAGTATLTVTAGGKTETLDIKVQSVVFAGYENKVTLAAAPTYGDALSQMITNFDRTGISASVGGTPVDGSYGLKVDGEWYDGSKLLDAGEHTWTITFKSDDNVYVDVTVDSGKFTVAKAKVSIQWDDVSDLVYDGEAKDVSAVVVSASANDDVQVVVTGGDAVNAGSYTATATGLTGEDSDNYELAATVPPCNYTIKPYEITALNLRDGNVKVTKVYDGTTAAAEPTGFLFVYGVGPVGTGEELALAVTAASAYPAKNVGDAHTVTLTPGELSGTGAASASNYKLAEGLTYSFTKAAITPAEYTYDASNLTATQVKVGSGLAALPTGSTTATGVASETLTGTFGWYSDAACTTALVDTDLSALTVGATKTVYWKFTPAASETNYDATPTTGSIVATIVEGDPQNITIGTVDPVTYGDAAFKLNITVTTTNNAPVNNGGAITYESSNESVLTVDASGNVTVVGAGTATITVKAAKIAGVYAEGTATVTITVAKKEVGITWAGYEDLVYDGTAKSVTATVTSGLVGSDTCDVTVTGGDKVDAGEHTATATALSNANYKLPAEATKEYEIAKANREFKLFVDGEEVRAYDLVFLTQGTPTLTVTVTSSTNLDDSFTYTLSSYDAAVFTVDANGVVTPGSREGRADLIVTIPATKNYNEVRDGNYFYIDVDLTPVDTASVLKSGSSVDGLTAVVDNENHTITVLGMIDADATGIYLWVNGSGMDDKVMYDITVTDGVVAIEGNTVTADGFEYTIDISGVAVKPADVTIENDGVLFAPATGEYSATGATSSDLVASFSDAILEAVSGLTAAEGQTITASVELQVTQASGSADALVFEVVPVLTITGSTDDPEPITLTEAAAPVTVTVTLPAGFPNDDLYVKQDGKYLSADNGSWSMDSFGTVELVHRPQAVTITFNYANGEQLVAKYYYDSIGAALPTDTTGTGTFSGWSINGVTYTTVTEALIGLDAEVEANAVFTNDNGQWISSYYIVTFVDSYGGIALPSIRVPAGTILNLNRYVPSHPGYTFAGWYADPALRYPVSVITVQQNTTVYAGWMAGNPFTDVKTTDWFYSAVQYVNARGLMSGMTTTTFGPNVTITRGMVAAILWRLEGGPVVSYDMNYSDVDSGKYYAEAIRWASAMGIVSGWNGKFNPDASITRQDLVSILWRYAKYSGRDVSVGENTNLLSWPDVFSVSEYAIPAMQWATGAGIISGSNGNLNPLGLTKRSEAASMLMRFLGGN